MLAKSQSPPLLVIVGPTGSGKSALAMQIAQEYNGEIICADSRTVYEGMDIGTAKPSAKDREKVPHYLLDVIKPDQSFTAADFKSRTLQVIDHISAKGKLPIMVGGSGLYIDSVIFNYEFGEPADPEKRKTLGSKSIEELQAECRLKNIELPININNKRHLIRAIELGGLPHRNDRLRSNTLVVGITTDREELRRKVSGRIHEMVDEGIVDEVKLLGQRYGWECEAMTGNIYRIFKDVVTGEKNLTQAIEEAIRSDMLLAKRQMTWFKRNPHIVWGTVQELFAPIDDFVKSTRRTS